VKQHHIGSSNDQAATVVALDTNHANAFVIDAVERFRPPSDQREMHDVFIVISEGRDGEPIARTFYAADLDDARQTHQENYGNEPIVAVQQRNRPASSPPEQCSPARRPQTTEVGHRCTTQTARRRRPLVRHPYMPGGPVTGRQTHCPLTPIWTCSSDGRGLIRAGSRRLLPGLARRLRPRH